jgi:hypothetical protein
MNRAALLAVAIATAVQVSAAIVRAQDNKFTCQVQGDSFVLDDTDFAAMASAGITREKFAGLAPSSQMRVSICDSRKVWRLIQVGKADACALDRYSNYAAKYFGPSERQAAMAAVAKTLGVGCR